MGFFDFFKRKKEPNIEDIIGSIMSQVFPNGKNQIKAIASSLNQDFGGKYPVESLMKSIAYCGSLLVTAKDKSAQRIVDMGMMLKPDNCYSREDAVCIYKAVAKSWFSTKFGIDNQDAFDAFYVSLGNVGNTVKIVNKRIQGSYGAYGISVNNPVPVRGVQSSYTFLDNLVSDSGEPIQYKRLGSYSSSITTELIDGYSITTNSGRSLGTIYICGYCNVDNPDPPTGFAIKGMKRADSISPADQIKAIGNQGTAVSQQQKNLGVNRPSPSYNTFSANRVIPTLINPPAMDTLMKRAKRANLGQELDIVFKNNGINIIYDQKIDISKLHDIFNDYTKYVRTNPLFINIKEGTSTNYIFENIKHYFKIGVYAYLVNNEYGEYLGRWSEEQYTMFIDSLKNQSFTIYFDMLDTFDNCRNDIPLFDKCFLSSAEQLYREYKDECIKEIEYICRAAYYAGFRYSLLKFGDDFLRQGLSEKDFGSFKLSPNLCNALSHGFKNNKLAREEFLYDEAIASQYLDVANVILKCIKPDLFDEKKVFTGISNGVSASIHIGIEAVLGSLHSNISLLLTEDKIKSLFSNKDFIAKYPFFEKSDITGFQCEITNGSNILNVKDKTLLEVKMKDLCADAFLLGMSIALQTSKG